MKSSLNSMDNFGFTLVELSIVLVIVGLLVGGVLQGRELIDASKRNSVVADITKYQTAYNAFKLGYDGIPGDFDEATDYWGAVSGSCSTVAGTGTQTCDGDGDGNISYVSSISPAYESWRVWQHLSNAEIINGNYIGISITGCSVVNSCTSPNVNAPESAYNGASWHLFTGNNYASWGPLGSKTALALGNPNNTTTNTSLLGVWYGFSLTTQIK